MNILFIGDIFAKPGRRAVEAVLKPIREEYKIDLVIANAENMRHGKGVSEDNLRDVREAGVDFFTSGNHIFNVKEIVPFLNDKKLPIIRPANYPPGVPGRGFEIVKTASGKSVLVVNLLGRLFIKEEVDCPFRTMDTILERFADVELDAIFVDFHAEATSEKAALANYLDGRVSAVLGTHTHVPTADARILPGGTAFQSDVGFVGPIDSIIGVDKKKIIEHFLTQLPVRHDIAKGPVAFNSSLIELESSKGDGKSQIMKAKSIEMVHKVVDLHA